jgi:hypothetical protein
MSHGTMASAIVNKEMRVRGFDAVLRLRHVQSRRHASAHAGSSQNQSWNQCKCPYTEKTHPASILSPIGVPCRAFPFRGWRFMRFKHSKPGEANPSGSITFIGHCACSE